MDSLKTTGQNRKLFLKNNETEVLPPHLFEIVRTHMQENGSERLLEGHFYYLKQAIGPIPAGIYLLEDVDDHCWHFSVGSKRRIRFMIIFGCSRLLRRVSIRNGRRQRTRESEFAENYYRALRESAVLQQPPLLNSPLSACMMPADLEARYDGPFAQKNIEISQKLN